MVTRRRSSTTPPDERAQDLAGALHEVSNALTVVLGWLDVASTELPAGSAAEALDVARTHARLGYGIARRAIGARSAESEEASAGPGNAQAIARRAVIGVTPEARRRGLELALDADRFGHGLIGNADAALQVLTNLLLNALAFTPRGRKVALSLEERDANAVFTVTDQGPGIAPEVAASLFEGPVSTRPGGAGLGLRHSHVLAAAEGGRLSVRRSGSDGSCLELEWPLAEARSGMRPQQPPLDAVRGSRVLVLEDDAAIRSLIELTFEARGIQAVYAGSAGEYDQALERGVYDLALVDLSPIADRAPAALDVLRARSPGVAIVLISGLASGVPESLETEVTAWVRKPFEMGEVLAVMARLLGTTGAQKASAAG